MPSLFTSLARLLGLARGRAPRAEEGRPAALEPHALDRGAPARAPRPTGVPLPGREPRVVTGSPAAAKSAGDAAVRLARLSVDDAGEYLLATGETLSLGHVQAGEADLGFLADVAARHARLSRNDTLRDGLAWNVFPEGEGAVWVEGEPVGVGGWRLVHGDRVDLGENLAFRVRVPDPASRTVLLDLLGGSEIAGAVHVVLLAPGETGRLRIGAAAERHLRIAGLADELSLILEGETLFVRTAGALRGAGEVEDGGLRLPFPPTERLDLVVGTAAGSRPPFGLSLAPAEVRVGAPEAHG